jgi:hypothetical protein
MGAKSLDLIHKYTNSKLMFDLVKVAAKSQTMYLCIVFIAVICIPIKSHQSNQICSTTWPSFIGCKYSSYFIPFCNLQSMYMYNLSRLRTIYTKYWNSTTKYLQLIKLRQVVEHIWFDWCDFIGIQITAIKTIQKYIQNKLKSLIP